MEGARWLKVPDECSNNAPGEDYIDKQEREDREAISNRGRQASVTELDTTQQEGRRIGIIKVAKYMQ